MSIEREIVNKLYESKHIKESSFESGGSIYKCVFGKYYKDDKEISREDYFKAKDNIITSEKSNSKGYENYTKDDFNEELSDLEASIVNAEHTYRDTPLDFRGDTLDKTIDKLFDIQNYIEDEDLYDRTEYLINRANSAKDIEYEDYGEDDYN